MQTLTKNQIVHLIQHDAEMMDILKKVESLDLPDWCICAGFIRNKVWDYIHENDLKTRPTDIDVMMFDSQDKDAGRKAGLRLKRLIPELDWDVGNQAFCHEENNDAPYSNTLDALSKLPETVTAIGVRSNRGNIELLSPHGIDDLVNCVIRPTPIFYEYPARKQIVIERLYKKELFEKWPKIKMII